MQRLNGNSRTESTITRMKLLNLNNRENIEKTKQQKSELQRPAGLVRKDLTSMSFESLKERRGQGQKSTQRSNENMGSDS